jgi:hypothetical protein
MATRLAQYDQASLGPAPDRGNYNFADPGAEERFTADQRAYDEKVKDLETKRKQILKDGTANAQAINAAADAAAGQQEFQKTQAQQDLLFRQSSAQLLIAGRPGAANIMRGVGQFNQQLAQTPEELKPQFMMTAAAEIMAQNRQMQIDVGREYATPSDMGRDIIGDPAGIRNITNPLEENNTLLGYILNKIASPFNMRPW